MRRSHWIMLTFFGLGLIASVIIGRCCEYFCDIRSIDTNLVAKLRRADFEKDSADSDGRTWINDAYRGFGVRVVRTSTSAGTIEERSCGWPLRCLSASVIYTFDQTNRSWEKSRSFGIPIRGNSFLSRDVPSVVTGMGMQAIDRLLPWRPRVIGLIINAAFWGAVLWCLWMLPGWMRTGRWLVSGRCTACGYPIGVSPVCTECGWPIRFRAWRHAPSKSQSNAKLDA